LGIISGDAWQIIWPCLLIVIGLGIVCKEKGKCCCGMDNKKEEK